MDKYRAVYISPIAEHDADKYVCEVAEALGTSAYNKLHGTYIYPKSIFGNQFHGTLTMFCKDNEQITDGNEILKNFDIRLTHITALCLDTKAFYGADGVMYNFEDNYFCKHNKKTYDAMWRDLIRSDSFCGQLLIDKKTGHIIDITLVVNPEPKDKYYFKNRVTKGFGPVRIEDIKTVGEKVKVGVKNTDEKMSQEDVDRLINEYTKTLGITL